MVIFNLSVLCLVFRVTEGLGQSKVNNLSCPKTKDNWIRVGETRFYIVQTPRRENYLNWADANKECQANGMKLAKINNITTFAFLGRWLEPIVKTLKLKDTWYWLDASFDEIKQNYVWSTGGELLFANFLYRQPRPIGVGGFMTYEDNYRFQDNVAHCLTLALPWPGWHEQNEVLFGHTTTFDEKPCVGVKKRHALCESQVDDCKLMNPNPFELTEGKEDYFHDGNWIMGNRKYIINWLPRTQNESRQYCESIGLQIYSPKPSKDACLIPLIKMWSRNITVSHFWSNWKYFAASKDFKDVNNTVVANVAAGVNFSEAMETRSSKLDTDFCVSLMMQYEMKDQLPKCISPSTCSWNNIMYVPANCLNRLGTICQHTDFETRSCVFLPEYFKNLTLGLEMTATLPFGYEGNQNLMRSRYKQTFGVLVCPLNYRMVRHNNTEWYKPKTGEKSFLYDYNEIYWLVDDEGFNKTINSKCKISMPGKRNMPTTTSCTTWHFYLCEKLVLEGQQSITNVKRIKMEWNKQIQPRHYPLLTNPQKTST